MTLWQPVHPPRTGEYIQRPPTGAIAKYTSPRTPLRPHLRLAWAGSSHRSPKLQGTECSHAAERRKRRRTVTAATQTRSLLKCHTREGCFVL